MVAVKIFYFKFKNSANISAPPCTRLVLNEKRPVHTGLIKIAIITLLCRYWVSRFRSGIGLCRCYWMTEWIIKYQKKLAKKYVANPYSPFEGRITLLEGWMDFRTDKFTLKKSEHWCVKWGMATYCLTKSSNAKTN